MTIVFKANLPHSYSHKKSSQKFSIPDIGYRYLQYGICIFWPKNNDV
jgi:hypothetical protein